MAKPIVFMFSGQGSHYYHMGRELYQENERFRSWILQLDKIATEIFGKSIIKTVYDTNKRISDVFDKTKETSPAIIMVEYALAMVLIENGIQPDYLLGYSLGEITSGILAGATNFEKMLEIIKECQSLLEKFCKKGKMIGVMKPINAFKGSPELHQNSELAAINFDSHFVIACSDENVMNIERFLKENEDVYQTLPVSQAFHSSLLDSTEKSYRDAIKKLKLRKPAINFISCAYGDEISEFNEDYLWEVFRKPILFKNTIQKMEEKGDYYYLDLGPSGTLANFAKYNMTDDSGSEIFPIMIPGAGQTLKNMDIVNNRIPRVGFF